MSDFALTDEQRKQLAVDYLTAARDNTEHLLIDKVGHMPPDGYKSEYAKTLADAYAYELQALKDDMQSDHPKGKGYIQNYTTKLIAENNVPDSGLPSSQILNLLSRDGAHQDILDGYANQLQDAESIR